MNQDDSGKYVFFGVVSVLACLFFFGFGWAVAHSVISHECQRLNSFYVGSVTYECKVK